MAATEAKLKIKAVQTVIPMKPTDPRQSCRVSLPENVGSAIYKTCFNLVFCYNKTSELESSGSLVAAWIKESLGIALSQQPILAGRLRHKDGGAEGELEIVSNDSGIRLIETQIDVSLQEFLDLKDKKDAEAALVFWENIDHEINPQFSPLFYIQVTSFSSGGYSIGLSCSLLLIDPFSLINFLKAWENIHLHLISNSPKLPVFYRPNGSNTSTFLDQSFGLAAKRACYNKTTIFNIGTKILNLEKNIHKKLAEICIDEVERKLGLKTTSRFTVYEKESSEEIKVTRFDREGRNQKPMINVNGMKWASWEDLGAQEICFKKGNKPAYCSSWIRAADDEAVVILVPPVGKDGLGMKIIATFPI